MILRRGDKWWARELERIQRAHAEERAQLIAAIAHLGGRPFPVASPVEPRPPVDGDHTIPIG